MQKVVNFFKGLTWGGRFFVAILLVGICYGAKWSYVDSGWFPKSIKESQRLSVADLPPLAYDKGANAPLRQLPDTTQLSQNTFRVRAAIMGWSAQNGVLYANGGPSTTKGSLMDENGINLQLTCQNNCTKQGEELYAFIQDYAAGNKNSSKGCHMTAWMGDGVPGLVSGLNEQITKTLGPDYIIQVFSAFGSSFGEDKFIFANPAVKQNPQLLKGSLIIGVLRDGDWNIAAKYADLNDIRMNNDPTTFDPEAINWIGVDDYIKAAEMYVQKVSEKRPIVIKGKRTGRDTTVVVNGCVTWTPGDATAFKQRGGVTVASTKDYGAQMPNTWVACKKWLQDNRTNVEKFILAGSLGGDQVKSHSSALTFASRIADQIYADGAISAKDWENYFKGEQYTDAQGNMVEIGGSRVFNLADQAEYFGLNGSVDKYRATYTTFGDLCVAAYPEVLSSYTKYEDAVDVSYMSAVYASNKNNTNMAAASLPTFNEGQTMSQFVSKKSVTIEFQFGSAEISAKSYQTLEKLSNDLIIAENLMVSIEGHTDDVGNDVANQALSQQRAEAIKNWLNRKDSKIFKNKINAVGYGESKPIADNSTDAGRQKNRRVEIILGR